MNIKNVSEFATFISQHGLASSDSSLGQIIQCLNNYKAACSCWKKEDKMKMYDTCNRVYYHAIKHVVPKLKSQFLATTSDRQISFYDDHNQLIGIISR